MMPSSKPTTADQYWLKHYQIALLESESLSAYARENGLVKQTFLSAIRRLCRKGLIHHEPKFHSVSPYITTIPASTLAVKLTVPSGATLELKNLNMTEETLEKITPLIEAFGDTFIS